MQVPDAVQRLINESGNTFHAKVARWFSDDGWKVSIGPYFMDQSMNKAREIDLVAEKIWPVRDVFNRLVGEVAIRLFIECKFITGHSVFWFAEKDQYSAMQMVCDQGGGLKKGNLYTKRHHYLAGPSKVAKLFATAKSAEQDPFYKALNQVLSAHTSMRHKPSISVDQNARIDVEVLNFPVIVCNSLSGAYASEFYGDGDPVQIEGMFQMEVQYAFADKAGVLRNEYFLIDVVDFDNLPTLSAALDTDAEVALHFMEPS